jgi:predicted DNA-binding protein
MIQKHISLPEDLDQKIQERVKRLKESENRVIRELIEQGLKTAKPMSLGESLRQLASLGIKGPRDLSQNIDKYIYEENEETIIFDSSGLTALMNETDEFHNRALSMSEILTDRASWRVILPYEIFAETVTALSKRVNREAGAKAAEAILFLSRQRHSCIRQLLTFCVQQKGLGVLHRFSTVW